ncbi:hypothetical protein ACNFU2_17730 [Chryseobacterium sp. PTM-20240506]|uniref:hypothetical protein n=1 Tax=unclassified Chryseobacterium TaxID=2593645 RepID=UPI0023597400|nr:MULTISPECIES: hypothetical protein [unclassified Chryseobacterium]MDC8106731.1 hypothetical protein [Chryseobacterium sp. B21-037]MDQ1805992.1 hypothetical protein [Chryseobacterium sp. CKR4-1]
MKNIYNKGTFRAFEYGKIGTYLKKYGNKKWRRTEQSDIDDQLSESIPLRKVRRQKQELVWVKITKEINGTKYSRYKKFHSERSFRSAVNSPHVIRYFHINNKTKKEK